jgi:hypothetical protein
MYEDEDNEEHGDRERWPWLAGTIVEQCGPDEWYVCIEVRELAALRDGQPAPRGTGSRNLYYPCCFRTARRSGRDPHRVARRRRRDAGRAGERGPGDPLCDGGRGLRRCRPEMAHTLRPHLRHQTHRVHHLAATPAPWCYCAGGL